jgi:hypothetical protein
MDRAVTYTVRVKSPLYKELCQFIHLLGYIQNAARRPIFFKNFLFYFIDWRLPAILQNQQKQAHKVCVG